MSFGSTTLSRPASADACPCGSGERYSGCCEPLLRGEPAPTAERLMRSRYTAFALGDAEHLARTWHPRTRPVDVHIEPSLRWLGLDVVGASEDAEGATVEFRARWIDEGERGTLHERSRFAKRAGRWFYLDGEVSA